MNIPKLRFKDNNGNDYPQWEKKLIKDILKIYHGKDYKNEPNEKKLYPVLGTGGIITYIDKFLCDWECVLIGRKGTINKPQYMKTPFWSVDTLFYSKPKLKQNPKFQYYLFQNINWKIYDESTGVPSLSASTIEHINRFIPTYAEQEKIASFFSTIDKKIENLTNTITSLENQKKGLLQQIFSQKLRFKDENGNNYPNWEKKKLGDIATLKNGISKSNEAFGHGKKFINLQDIFNKSYIFNDNYSLVNVTEKELSENNLLKGDVLFVRSSVKREGVGLPCVIMENLIDTVYSGFIIRCRFNINENIYLHYKKYCFLEFSFRKALLKKSSSSANTNINQDNLSKLYVKLPCLEEQTKIADFLSAFDRKLENQKAQLEHWKQIKKGLLQQMFV